VFSFVRDWQQESFLSTFCVVPTELQYFRTCKQVCNTHDVLIDVGEPAGKENKDITYKFEHWTMNDTAMQNGRSEEVYVYINTYDMRIVIKLALFLSFNIARFHL